jgi:putative endonuclease
MKNPNKKWYVYILKCADDTLYTGITTDVNRRLNEHNKGTGAKYTKTRLPVVLMAVSEASDRSEASKEEYRIKQLTRKEKLLLIDGNRNTSTT